MNYRLKLTSTITKFKPSFGFSHYPTAMTLLCLSTVGISQGCSGEKSKDTANTSGLTPPSSEPAVQSPIPTLRRLTIAQYTNTISDVFGEGLLIPSNLEPDIETEGFKSLGAGISAISPVGVERYETASYSIATQVIEDLSRLEPWFACDLTVSPSQACVSNGIDALGLELWRKPLTSAQRERLNGLYQTIAGQTDSVTGVEYTLATLLQSPNFLYRSEFNTSSLDASEQTVYTLDAWSLASRLSFFLWNSGPDVELLELAQSGDLLDSNTLEEQVDRMMADPKFKTGVRSFFDELLHLYDLDSLTKDPLVYTHASPDLYASAKEETFRTIEYILDNELDFRDLLTTKTTFVDRRLATLYGIPAPVSEGFGEVQLTEGTGRRGLLTQASMLNLHAHATASSPTLRGVFIRKTLLCQMVPPPPADVDTSIPEATDEAPTMRERLEQHFEDPSCAGCHKMMDLVGLGLENFDGIGQWRDLENNAPIDPSGNIDGVEFLNAWEMGEVVSNHRNLGPCLTDQVYSYALGHRMTDAEEAHQDWLVENLEYNEWNFNSLVRTIALSEAFRSHGTSNHEGDSQNDSEDNTSGNDSETGSEDTADSE